MIASGDKKEEYREIKEYWIKRFCETHKGAVGGDLRNKHKAECYTIKKFDTVIFKNGYSSNAPKISFEITEIEIDRGNSNWGAERGKYYFVIKLGDRV
jgi:hypothetical protein